MLALILCRTFVLLSQKKRKNIFPWANTEEEDKRTKDECSKGNHQPTGLERHDDPATHFLSVRVSHTLNYEKMRAHSLLCTVAMTHRDRKSSCGWWLEKEEDLFRFH